MDNELKASNFEENLQQAKFHLSFEHPPPPTIHYTQAL